jgi:hypothetical protein
MHNTMPSTLSDCELLAEVERLSNCERRSTAALVAHLAELDVRRLHLGAGFSSLFAYCTRVLHLSEGGAYSRIEAARASRRYPQVIDLLESGALNVTTARLLSPHLTAENHCELLAAASYKSRREVEALLARRAPKPDVRPLVRKLPVPIPEAPAPVRAAEALSSIPAAPPVSLRPVAVPLSADRFAIRFTASASTREKLKRAQDLLRHVVPSGDPAEIFDRALEALLDVLSKRKFGSTVRPRASRGQARASRNIPAAVRRAVNLRDRGECAFVAADGRRCGETAFLEFHHVDPHAKGGPPTVTNIELRCRAHNAYEARVAFGRWWSNSSRDELQCHNRGQP